MLSRVADAIHWMGRYVERAENVARILDVSLQLVLDLPDPQGNPWEGVVEATGDAELFNASYERATRDAVVRFLMSDPKSPNSILSCFHQARENARSVREVISSEMWEEVNRAYLHIRELAGSPAVLEEPHDFLEEVKRASHLFVGSTYLTMAHNEGWHFGRMGRLLESADQTSRIIDAKQVLLSARGPERAPEVSAIREESQLASLLRSVSAFEMYRQRHGQITHESVIGFLILDKKFPRSIRYGLNKAERSLHAITGTPLGSSGTLAERRLGRLNAECEFAAVEEILAEGLHEWLDKLQLKLNDVGAAIFETFLATRPHVGAVDSLDARMAAAQ